MMREHARVALVTTYYHPVLGGAEAAARRLAEFLARRGHEIFVLTTLTDAALPRTDTIGGVRVERIGAARPRRGARKWTILPQLTSALWKRRNRYDTICVVDYRGIGVAAVLVGRMLHKPVAIQAQTEGVLSASNLAPALARVGLAPGNALVRMATWPLRRAYASADAVACISRAIQAEAFAEGVPRERVHDLPNPVDTERFHATTAEERSRVRAQHGWPADRLIGMFVGRLSREKGVVDLLRAWERVAPSADLVIVGPDMPGHPWDEGPAVREMAVGERLSGHVHVFGATNDAAPLLRAADVAIVPSHWESFGLSAAEAMATGLPVVASAVGGLTDFIVDGENGLLVPPKSPEALAAAIQRLIDDGGLRQRLGTAARQAVLKFDERLVLDRFGALLDRLAGIA